MTGMIISLLGGALGGNVAGKMMKNYSLGTLWNSVVGILGGGLGCYVLCAMSPAIAEACNSGATDIGSILTSVAGGGVGGGILLGVIGAVKKAMK